MINLSMKSWNGILCTQGPRQNASRLQGQPDTPFCLSAYKEDLGKNYSRLVLYLCTENSDENNETVEEDTFNHTGFLSDMVMECRQDMGNNK